MTDKPEPLPVRPAATVMLVRDTPDGISVFLMRRHSAMEFAAGVMVFPGGGVDDRDRNADISWHGPGPQWWADRFGIEANLAEALVCAAARETFEETGFVYPCAMTAISRPPVPSTSPIAGDVKMPFAPAASAARASASASRVARSCGSSVPKVNFLPLRKVMSTASQPDTL